MARRRSVLLVDPHPDSREMYAEFLRHAGFDVVALDNAADALASAPRADVIVTGIMLRGDSDGVEFVRQIRQDGRTKHLPMIVLTACTMPEDRARAEAAGCDLFVPKPCVPANLLHHIRHLMFGRSRRRAAKAALHHSI